MEGTGVLGQITALEMDSIGAHASMQRPEFDGKGAWMAGRYPIAA